MPESGGLRVGESTTLANSMSPQMSELVEDAIASWCGDEVGHFCWWPIRVRQIYIRFTLHTLTNMRQIYIVYLPIYLYGYLDTWSSFEAAKTAPWRSRESTTFVNSLSPSDEWAGRGCYCSDAVTKLGIFGWSGMSSRNLSSSNLNFSV